MTGNVIDDPNKVWRVHSGTIPPDIDGAEKLGGQFVGADQAQLLKDAGFVVFNWGEHLEKKAQAAKVTIGDLLKAKANGKPSRDVAAVTA